MYILQKYKCAEIFVKNFICTKKVTKDSMLKNLAIIKIVAQKIKMTPLDLVRKFPSMLFWYFLHILLVGKLRNSSGWAQL